MNRRNFARQSLAGALIIGTAGTALATPSITNEVRKAYFEIRYCDRNFGYKEEITGMILPPELHDKWTKLCLEYYQTREKRQRFLSECGDINAANWATEFGPYGFAHLRLVNAVKQIVGNKYDFIIDVEPLLAEDKFEIVYDENKGYHLYEPTPDLEPWVFERTV